MKHFEIKARERDNFTKAAVKQLRKEGRVPCVLYGNKMEPLHFSVLEKELKNLIYTPYSYIVELSVEKKKHICLLQQAQFHPLHDRVLHLDFLAIDPKKPVSVTVPVVLTGNSIGVREGGKMHILNRKLLIRANLEDLPDSLNIDVTKLALGGTIAAGDLKFDNIQILTPASTIVCMVKMTRASISDAAAEAAEEAEEGAAEENAAEKHEEA
ncbi:MAG: 50S ribosomal protein L25 [Bacteroidales bacterium]|jgi:large subunit ribosomal protein L25|nr:50S ribosomal protein L25 [Bacteroidales bacterium]NLK80035.1 50S ribosomal protein L25 [Bacteroidales bacterium]HKM30870.1 50S ribosomal protein L25 [Bacteroidales bacterium]HPX79384.1 50S ribosomal protein L25 [Bacteroidales bacterium]HQB23313.1 50S ribosomal protein L25 [Bacteroidales bacterium]